MNDAAFRVQVIEPQQDLFRDLLDDVRGNPSMLVPLDQAQQVLAQHLEHHANVRSIGAGVSKVVEQLYRMASSGMVGVRGDELLKQLDLVESRVCIMTIRFDDLERDVLVDTVFDRRIIIACDEKGKRVTYRQSGSKRMSTGLRPLRGETQQTHVTSLASHTVLKCPQPSFRTITYRPSLNASPICTG